MKLIRYGLPLAVFVAMCVFLGLGLKNDPRLIPSPLIDKPAPEFALPALLDDSNELVTNQSMLGKVWFLNVWASWCAGCKVEHPVLLKFAEQEINLVGLNYKDKAQDAKQWLVDYHNPYQQVLVDSDGRVGIDFGVYGVPETFLIDQKGQIRHKHTGPVSEADIEQLVELSKQLEAES